MRNKNQYEELSDTANDEVKPSKTGDMDRNAYSAEKSKNVVAKLVTDYSGNRKTTNDSLVIGYNDEDKAKIESSGNPKDEKKDEKRFRTEKLDYDQRAMHQEKTGRQVKIEYDKLPYSELGKEPTLMKENNGDGVRIDKSKVEAERSTERSTNRSADRSKKNNSDIASKNYKEIDRSSKYPPRNKANSKSEKERKMLAKIRIAVTTFIMVLLLLLCILVFKNNSLKKQVATLTEQTDTIKDKDNTISSLKLENEDLKEQLDAIQNPVEVQNPNVSNTGNEGGEVSPDATPLPSGAKQYTVESGDTLSKISRKFYGDTVSYQKIIDANNLTSENLSLGQVLVIPE